MGNEKIKFILFIGVWLLPCFSMSVVNFDFFSFLFFNIPVNFNGLIDSYINFFSNGQTDSYGVSPPHILGMTPLGLHHLLTRMGNVAA